MAILAVVLWLTLVVWAFVWTRQIVRNPRRMSVSVICILAGLVVWLVGFEALGYGRRLIPWDDFVYFQALPRDFGIFMLLGLCWWKPGKLSHITLGLLIGVFTVFGLGVVSGPLYLPLFTQQFADGKLGTKPTDQEIYQSTGWSCAPTALVWAARLKGVPADELQVAQWSACTPFHGTTDRGVLRAAHRLGFRTHLYRGLSLDQLRVLPRPSLISWRLHATVMHAVVLIDLTPQSVTLGDPLTGRSTCSPAEFEQRWMRDAITLE